MKLSKVMKWVTGGLEAFWAIPILGGSIILGLLWVPLAVMLVLHIITLVICSQENESRTGSIVGIVTSMVAWIPLLGWAMHLLTAVLLLLSAAKRETRSNGYY